MAMWHNKQQLMSPQQLPHHKPCSWCEGYSKDSLVDYYQLFQIQWAKNVGCAKYFKYLGQIYMLDWLKNFFEHGKCKRMDTL